MRDLTITQLNRPFDPLRVRLLQRGSVALQELSTVEGLDSVVDFDYMGSAEFEDGSMFRSLKRMLAGPPVSANQTYYVAKDGRRLLVLCAKNRLSCTRESVINVVNRRVTLQELSRMDRALDCDGTTVNFWWDIEHDWIAVLGAQEAALVSRAFFKMKSFSRFLAKKA